MLLKYILMSADVDGVAGRAVLGDVDSAESGGPLGGGERQRKRRARTGHTEAAGTGGSAARTRKARGSGRGGRSRGAYLWPTKGGVAFGTPLLRTKPAGSGRQLKTDVFSAIPVVSAYRSRFPAPLLGVRGSRRRERR